MPNIASFPSRRPLRAALLLLAALAGLSGSGCQTYRNLGKGQAIDPDRPRPHHEVKKGGQEIIAEITTDASGQVVNITLQKSSGREAIDNYVASSIRSGWPPIASTRSVVSVRHLADGGFSEPSIISNTPIR